MIDPRLVVALATLAAEAYAPSPAGIVIDAGDDIRAVLTEVGGKLAVIVRGTEIKSADNWITDLDAFPEWDDHMGFVPSGFLRASRRLIPMLAPHVAGRDVVYGGHSLGGSVAVLLAAKAMRPPAAITAFEPARTGLDRLATALAHIPGIITRFGDDPVPEVPFIYRHPFPVTAIGHAMPDPFSCHAIAGVVAWLQAALKEAA